MHDCRHIRTISRLINDSYISVFALLPLHSDDTIFICMTSGMTQTPPPRTAEAQRLDSREPIFVKFKYSIYRRIEYCLLIIVVGKLVWLRVIPGTSHLLGYGHASTDLGP